LTKCDEATNGRGTGEHDGTTRKVHRHHSDVEAVSKTVDKHKVILEVEESHVLYAMRSSYNGMIIIAENYKERERIMRKAERSEDFANKVIDAEAERLMY
jgi:hypothetical protein